MLRVSDILNRVARLLESKQARLDREYDEARRENNKLLRSQMKPDDDIVGFMFDDDKPRGTVISVRLQEFLALYQSQRKDSVLDRQRIRYAAKAFRANNNLHLMVSVYVDEQGNVRLLEGNHRLEILRQKDLPAILINVINQRSVSEDEFADHLKMIIEKTGSEGLGVVANPKAVFCHVDFDDAGHFPRILEERQHEPYYTVHDPSPPKPRTSMLIPLAALPPQSKT